MPAAKNLMMLNVISLNRKHRDLKSQSQNLKRQLLYKGLPFFMSFQDADGWIVRHCYKCR